LRSDTSAQGTSNDLKTAPAAQSVRPEDRAERRQVTVMFSDLVGSTALSARMDPEDLREVISAYQKCVAETVQRFGGFVANYMGDGVLVYFGYPKAHEDDAERAVQAGLELSQLPKPKRARPNSMIALHSAAEKSLPNRTRRLPKLALRQIHAMPHESPQCAANRTH
jgi:class 3 adenylate cyclase